jgi:two-component system chemotaxis response regulator CheB
MELSAGLRVCKLLATRKEVAVGYEKVLVIGASAGGIEALSTIVGGLPADLQAPILVVMHISPESPGYLPQILASRGRLPAKNAVNGETMLNGTIYVARPNHHLIVEKSGRLLTPRGPRENRSRPAIDPLFRSAALAFGSRVIGLVLSGGLDDGTAGLRGIKMCGGTTIVQDPLDALVSSMPNSALRNATVDFCRPAAELAELIVQLVASAPPKVERRMDPDIRKQLETEIEIARDAAQAPLIKEFGIPSIFTCPECHGALLRLRGDQSRYRCHTGHAFTEDTLLAELDAATEEAIWSAVRSLQEEAMLLGHLAEHWQGIDPETANVYRERSEKALARADSVRSSAKKAPNPASRMKSTA